MRVAVVIAPKDFRDETVARAKSMLERWNVKPVIVGFVPRECVGSHGAVYMPDANINKVKADDFDAILLVDGRGIESYKLYEVVPLIDLVREAAQAGKTVAGVGNAVKMLAKANIVAGKKIAIPKDAETDRMVRLYKGVPSKEFMECETNVMSLSDYANTEEFVGAILDKLGVR